MQPVPWDTQFPFYVRAAPNSQKPTHFRVYYRSDPLQELAYFELPIVSLMVKHHSKRIKDAFLAAGMPITTKAQLDATKQYIAACLNWEVHGIPLNLTT